MPSTNTWAQNAPEGAEQELTTPTGNTCRAKKLSVEAMMTSGILSDADTLTSTIQRFVKTKRTGKGKNMRQSQELDEGALMREPGALGDVMGLVDKAIPEIVVSPPVRLHYRTQVVGKTKVTRKLDEDERNEIRSEVEGVVFTDQIDFQDKMFLFEWASGGLKSLMSFRR